MSGDGDLIDMARMRQVMRSEQAANETEMYVRIGRLLLRIQAVEQALRFILTFVIQKGQSLTLESLEAQTEAERKKTIGYFLSQLRTRAEIHERVDAHLTKFLGLRNDFVHRLEAVPGWCLETEQGLRSANEFISDVEAHTIWVYFWLAGITRSWSLQVGYKTEYDTDPSIDFIDHTFLPFAEFTVDEKPK